MYGGDDRIGALTDKVKQNDEIRLGNLTIRCLFTPCHTTGHICYYIDSPKGQRAVFTGDTLFQGGCGRFFEGTATDMHAALLGQLSKLPDDTNVYCGHEYSLQNLAFGKYVEPNNQDILKRIELCTKMRTDNLPTVWGLCHFMVTMSELTRRLRQMEIFSYGGMGNHLGFEFTNYTIFLFSKNPQ